MKKYLIFTSIFIFISGCSTVKKQTQLKESQVSNNTSTEQTNSQTVKNSEVQSQSNAETNSNTVTFYKPDEISDYEKILARMRENNEPYSNIGIVKSISNSNTKQNDTQVAKTEEKNNTSAAKANNNSLQTYKEEKTVAVTEPFWLKYKWYLIIGGIAVATVLFFVIKNKLFRFLKFIKPFFINKI